MIEAEVANRFDERPSGHPLYIEAGSTFVPVEGVGSDGFDPFITRVPIVGVVFVGFWLSEREGGHDPDTASEFDTLTIEDPHKVAPCSDEVSTFAVRNVEIGFGFVVERQPDLRFIGPDCVGPVDHILIEWVTGLSCSNIGPKDLCTIISSRWSN